MKYQCSLQVGMAVVVILTVSTHSPVAELGTPASGVTNAQPPIAQNHPVLLATGHFVKRTDLTLGTVQVTIIGRQRFLVLSPDFQTSNQGKDLHVLMDTNANPPQAYKAFGSYVNLGKLEKFRGTQRYPIPDALNLASFKSVVIWCRSSNRTFGYAVLHHP